MGSNSSLIASSKATSSPRKLPGSSGSVISRTKSKLSSLFCGSFTSKSTFELEACPENSSVSDTEKVTPIGNDFHDSMVESSSILSSQLVNTSSLYENGASLRRNNSSTNNEAVVEASTINFQTNRDQIDFRDTAELLPCQPTLDLVSGNATNCIGAAVDTPDATREITGFSFSGHDQSRNLSQDLIVSRADSDNLDYDQDLVSDHNYSALRSLSVFAESLPRFPLPGDDLSHVTTISSPGFVLSNNDLDVVSISSNFLSSSIGEINYHDLRRYHRTLFRDAISSRSFRQHIDPLNIVFHGDLADDHPSSHERLPGGNLDDNGAGYDPDSFSARRRRRNERRRLLRAERIIGGGRPEGRREITLCVSGLHPNGSCSCNSLLTAEESSTFESISRIIMLAEALFEVLDEIHHQSLSLSLSFLPLPAPESLVDTFPLKYHKNAKSIESNPNNVQQCYICLADYEDGDKLRVLPCNHEYHMPCIDKWLKEINRVCPLCRYNVCDGVGECSASTIGIPS